MNEDRNNYRRWKLGFGMFTDPESSPARKAAGVALMAIAYLYFFGPTLQ